MPAPLPVRAQGSLVFSNVTADPAFEIPARYLLSAQAPDPRTLVDILYDTAARYPDAAAIDDGTVQLTYSELIADIEDSVAWLGARGIGRGDRIGIRMPSGSYALYVSILSTLAAGAAYVPVDADDPPERADLVFSEAQVVAIITEAGLIRGPGSSRGWRAGAPLGRDDAWIIFTSGSTGTPKGVAVTHRSAAAFVDAEARMFLQDNPIGPGDRVLAGLVGGVRRVLRGDVAGLAARRVPGARAAVTGAQRDGSWAVAGVPGRHRGLDGADAGLVVARRGARAGAVVDLRGRGLPAGTGRAARHGDDGVGREVWNTYGPTEATVVACLAKLDGNGPVSIGLPLPGWDLAVVDQTATRSATAIPANW